LDKDGFVASAKEIRGAVKHVVGTAAGGDAMLMSDGKAGEMEGNVQNTIGRHDDVLEEICARLRKSLPGIEITIEHFPANRSRFASSKCDKTRM